MKSEREDILDILIDYLSFKHKWTDQISGVHLKYIIDAIRNFKENLQEILEDIYP